MTRRAWLLACALTLGACSSKPAHKTHQVEIKGMQFVPRELDVNVGDTIVWTNDDFVPHTVTSGNPSVKAFDSKSIDPKVQWSYEVTSAGQYAYVCTFHPTMHGSFTAH
jgi:plastocyanin